VEIVVPDRLVGESVFLRPLRTTDAAEYAKAFGEDDQMGRLLGLEEDPTEADVARRVESAEERARVGRGVQLAVCTAQDRAFAGEILLHSFAWKHRRCEIGFWLVPSVRGRGLARDAIERTLEWAFADLSIERMEMATTTDNGPTRAIAGRIGFVEEGVQRKRNVERGARVDMVVFGLLASKWTRKPARAE
jgi:RimJ/RimL family protein N-acetyltransferase